MTQDAYLIFSTFVRQIWRLFSEWYLPGTNVTPAGFILLVAFLAVSVRFMKHITWSVFDETSNKKNGD